MHEAQQTRVRRAKVGMVTAGLVGLSALAACSSSSSGGSRATGPTPNAAESRLGITPIPGLTPGGHGPNGDITAPASNPPTKTSPGGSEVFPNVTGGKRLDKLRNHVSTLSGVHTVTYYPQFNQLQVYYDKTATSADRQRVYGYVTAHYPASGSSPSASPAPTPSATPS